MKKYSIFFILSIFLMGCESADEAEQTENDTILNTIADSEDESTELDDAIDDVIAVTLGADFEYIEDYTLLDTKTKLYTTFGEDNIKDSIIWYAEGTEKRECSYLTNPFNNHIVKFVWNDKNNETLSNIEFFHLIYDEDYNVVSEQMILSKNGLFTGMSLSELVVWNDAEFEFLGFGWDYEGGIIPKEGSAIFNSELTINMELNCGTDFDKFNDLIGDIALQSNAKEVVEAPIFIGVLNYWVEE